jgi:hypothetical protein
MPEQESALVLVQPNDTIQSITARASAQAAGSVALLVPADTVVMQVRRQVAELRQILAQAGIEITIISSDPRVLQAARESSIATVAIEGASVVGPLIPTPPRKPRPAAKPVVAAPPDHEDSDLLNLLDLPDALPDSPTVAAPAYRGDDADLYASLDDLSDTIQSNEQAARRVSTERRAPQGAGVAARETVPMPVARPAARERSAPALRRALEDRPAREAAAARRTPRREEPVAGRRRLREEEVEDRGINSVDRSNTRGLPVLILLVAVTMLLIGGAWWAWNSRVVVTVYAPAASVREVPFSDEVLSISQTQQANAPTIQAAPVSTEVAYTVTGQVSTQTTSPAGKAKGVVKVINTIEQPLTLPEGTEFVGRNLQNAEVRFVVDAAVTVPAATTSVSLSGRSTVYGSIDIPVTARSAGAASNVPENTVKQILIPGQQLFDCGSSNFICQNGPISGGSDEPQWIVTEADVQAVLGDALTGLYNQGIQDLRVQTVNGVVDTTTIRPSPQQLGFPDQYEPPIVEPPIGAVADPNTRSFTVTIKTRFTALAVPADRSVETQVAAVLGEHFAQRATPLCGPLERIEPEASTWSWDGVSLKVSGAVVCVPQGVLPAEVRLQVREALRGRDREAADQALRDLQERGLIGEYQIPEESNQLPSFDILLDLRFVETAGPRASGQ